MAHSILVIDDDTAFLKLIQNVLVQAKYEVEVASESKSGLERALSQSFDLVIVDHQMPEMDGTALIEALQQEKPDQVILMVSAHLDNHKIRELIQRGVYGVFPKPLNVFALLKRVEQALMHSKEAKEEGDPLGNRTDAYTALGFHFQSFPCLDKQSQTFAQNLHDARDFKNALLLSGPAGTHFKDICKDFEGFGSNDPSSFFYITPRKLHEAFVKECLHSAKQAGQTEITFVISNLQELSLNQSKLIYNMIKKEDEYSQLNESVRFLFCLDGDLDALYDNGVIEEDTYILMGSKEIRVPSLDKCRNDIPALAQKILTEEAQRRGFAKVPKLDKGARTYLKDQDWPQNYASLESVLMQSLPDKEPDGEEDWSLAASDLGKSWDEKDFYSAYVPVRNLYSYLKNLRDDYIKAFYYLSGKNHAVVQRILNIDTDFMQTIVDTDDRK